ncbi:MAG: HAMP domain-containing sensor histidine kinase [Verrucomicrobiota bacterium]
MKFIEWRGSKGLGRLLSAMRPSPRPEPGRVVSMQLHVVLPAKAGVIGIVLYYLFYSGGLNEVTVARRVVLETLQEFFAIYVVCNFIAAVLFVQWRRFPAGIFQWVAFLLGLLDGLFVAGLALITGGFDSTSYWVLPGLIVLNALSIPLATPQIVLNLLLSVFFLGAGILNNNLAKPEWTELPLTIAPGRNPARSNPAATNRFESTNGAGSIPALDSQSRTHRSFRGWPVSPAETLTDDQVTEPHLLRLFVLWLLTACCYGVQVLLDRQARALEEGQEFEMRERQLRSAGRLAAEFAHQIKNPLAIINNAAFSLQRALKEGRLDVSQQVRIIQEEVERSDRIVTQLMGYAQLTEGRVEKLSIVETLDAAVEEVFPPAAGYGVRVVRQYSPPFPALLMLRRHLSEIFVNLLQNAREASNGAGTVTLSAQCPEPNRIRVVVEDNGPGIPADKLRRVFEAYYTTKEKGTGLGLAIVKNNVELYGGTVELESELGKGARFIVSLPARTANRRSESA